MDDFKRPYVGRTKNELAVRIKQHAQGAVREVGQIAAKFHLVGNKGDLQVLEQLIMDLISGANPDLLANDTRALSEKRPKKRDLRAKLAKLKLCK